MTSKVPSCNAERAARPSLTTLTSCPSLEQALRQLLVDRIVFGHQGTQPSRRGRRLRMRGGFGWGRANRRQQGFEEGGSHDGLHEVKGDSELAAAEQPGADIERTQHHDGAGDHCGPFLQTLCHRKTVHPQHLGVQEDQRERIGCRRCLKEMRQGRKDRPRRLIDKGIRKAHPLAIATLTLSATGAGLSAWSGSARLGCVRALAVIRVHRRSGSSALRFIGAPWKTFREAPVIY